MKRVKNAWEKKNERSSGSGMTIDLLEPVSLLEAIASVH